MNTNQNQRQNQKTLILFWTMLSELKEYKLQKKEMFSVMVIYPMTSLQGPSATLKVVTGLINEEVSSVSYR